MTEQFKKEDILFQNKTEHADVLIFKRPSGHNYSADGIQLVRLDSLSAPLSLKKEGSGQELPSSDAENISATGSSSAHSPIRRTRGI